MSFPVTVKDVGEYLLRVWDHLQDGIGERRDLSPLLNSVDNGELNRRRHAHHDQVDDLMRRLFAAEEGDRKTLLDAEDAWVVALLWDRILCAQFLLQEMEKKSGETVIAVPSEVAPTKERAILHLTLRHFLQNRLVVGHVA
jgi:hypothetical protein